MAIKPVEYIKDSSTVGFAEAGDQKQITKTNANTIQKDVDQGNTKDLDNAQAKYLDGNVDYDNLDYSDEEMEKVGEQQIDTEGEDGESLEEKDQKGGAAAAATGAAVGAAGAAAMAIITATSSVEAVVKTGSKIPGAMLAAGIVASVGAGVALACSFEGTFDPNLGERKNQTGAAEQNNAVIQQYIDALSADMDMMNEDVTMYEELSAMQTAAQVETITDLGAMQAELQVYQAQGNTSKVAEIKGKMGDVKKNAEETSKEPQKQMDGLKENIETYTGNNAEASGVKTSGDTVAEFLKQGDQMKNFANAAKIASQLGAVAMLLGVAAAALRVGKDLAAIFTAPFASLDNAGMVMFIAGGVMMGLAANNFGNIADSEGAAGSAGNEMAANLANLQANIDGQAGFTEATSGTYGETDEAATETVEKNQEATDKANSKDKNRGARTSRGKSGIGESGFGFSTTSSANRSGANGTSGTNGTSGGSNPSNSGTASSGSAVA